METETSAVEESTAQETEQPSRITVLSQECYKCLSEAVKISNTLPTGEARDLYSTYTDFHAVVDHMSENVLLMANSILKSQGLQQRFRKSTTSTDVLSEANDAILDNVHVNSEAGKKARASNVI